MKHLLPPVLLLLLAGPVAVAAEPDPLAIERAMEELKSDDWILAWRAMTQLARHKAKEAVPELRAILSGTRHPWVRGRALVALAEVLGKNMLADALAFVGSDRAELRAAAVESLGILGAPQGEKPIRERLADPVPDVRYQAVVALARLKGAGAWETIEPLLGDKDPAMVRHAIRASVHVDTSAARARIVSLLEHENRDVRGEAAGALGRVGMESAIPALLDRMARDPDATVRVTCESALARFEPGTLGEPALAAIEGDDPALYRAALTIVGLRPNPEVCDRVARLFRQPDEKHASYTTSAFEALVQFDPDRYRDLFAQHLPNEKTDIRRKAIECLARCRQADLYPLLKPSLVDKDSSVRSLAFQTLRKASSEPPKEGIVAYLAEPLQAQDARTAEACLSMVHDHVTPPEFDRALGALAPMLGGKDSRTRERAAEALDRVCDDAGRRRVAAAQGAVAEWVVVGPFPSEPSHRAHEAVYFPEREIDLEKGYPEHHFGSGAQFRVGDASSGGDRRRGLILHLPHERNSKGNLRVAYTLRLPEGKGVRLVAGAGIQDDAKQSDGVNLQVVADKTTVLEQVLSQTEGWKSIDLDLSGRAGKTVVLGFLLSPREHSRDDRLVIAGPRIVAADGAVVDLLALAPRAAVTIELPGHKDEMHWQPLRTVAIDGTVLFHDLFSLPAHYQAAYALADLESQGDQTVQFRLKWQNDLVLWLNGKRVFEKRGAREETVEVPLQNGRNRILAKVANERDAWTLRVRVTDKDGSRLDTVRVVPRQ